MNRVLQKFLLAVYKMAHGVGLFSNPVGRAVFEKCYLFYKKHFEAGHIELLRSYVGPGTIVIDVGANIGFFTILFAHWVSDDGIVLAFEPESNNYRSLNKRVKSSGVAARVKTEMRAVTTESGSVNLAINPLHPADHRVSDDGIEVPATSIDDYVRDRGSQRVSLIKIDVQGHEYSVLRGADSVIADDRPALFVEIDPEALSSQSVAVDQLFNWIYAKGYRAHILSGSGVSPAIEAPDKLVMPVSGYIDLLFLPVGEMGGER